MYSVNVCTVMFVICLFWTGDWTARKNEDGCFNNNKEISEKVWHNGLHVYFTKSGFHPDPKYKGQYCRLATVHSTQMLNKFKRRKDLVVEKGF